MAISTQERPQWLAFAVAIAAVVVLCLRFETTIAAVLSVKSDALPALEAPARDGLEELALRDSLIASARVDTRDPFQPPPRPPVKKKRPAPRVELPVVVPDPTLRALLYDTVSPSIQLTLGDVTSGWLRIGETFRGWTVRDVTPTSATVTNGSRRLVLGS